MGDFPGHERGRNDANDLTSGGECGIGKRSHQANIRPAINHADALGGERGAK
jgi:hypothetical protein